MRRLPTFIRLTFNRLSAACLSLSALSAIAAADPISLPSDTRWALRVDVAALTGGGLSALVKTTAQQPLPAAVLAGITAATGTDPLKDIDEAVIAGPDRAEGAAVVYLRGRFDGARLAELARSLPQSAAEEAGAHTIFRWQDEQKNKPAAGCLARPDLLLLGQQPAALRHALAALAEPAARLHDGDPLLVALAPAPRQVLSAGALDLGRWAYDDATSPLVRTLERLTAQLTEDGTQLTVQAIGSAADDATAQRLQEALTGIKAFGQLAPADPKQPLVQPLLSNLSISRDGRAVTLRSAVPVALLGEAAKAAVGRRRAER